MSDTVTILRSPGRYATKQFTMGADGKIVSRGYDEAKHFRVFERTVSSLATLGALLDRVSIDPFSTIIRARPIEGIDREHSRRLLHADRTTGDPATFQECARRWLLLDIDGIKEAPPCKGDDGAGIARWLLGHLPEEFATASHWWAFTSSAGIKPGVRMRLAFWLERAVDQWELDAWFAGTPVDCVVFRPVQVIYLATPIFRGMSDPVERRSGVCLDGDLVVGVPTIVRPDPVEAPRWLASNTWRAVADGERSPAGDLDRALKALVSTPAAGANVFGGVGRHHALFTATLSVCGHIRRGWLEKAQVRAAFATAAAHIDGREEIERHIENAFRQGGVS